MIDYKYLKENGLYESHLRFMRAINEGYGYAPIEEADDDEKQNDGGMPLFIYLFDKLPDTFFG